MRKKRREQSPQKANTQAKQLYLAEKAICQIAIREGTTVENVRKHIQVAMMGGLLSNDPAIKAAWKRIPKAGEVPTPEEVIAYYAEKMRK
ncbi:MAG: hypothetical protein VB023_12020 [Oscillibacter sp.]|nr:hypothetical protein [Oscillibacter sp.]